tara:strand:- start:145 stop:612 length:468 start_codon:yes stop_codon:yes gene_type:complete
MSKQELFTVNKWSYQYGKGSLCEIIPIFGPTNEKFESMRPVNSNVRLGSYVWSERNEKLKNLENYKVKNKYFQSGRMEEWENEKKNIILEANWKLRVLNEQAREEKKRMEAAEALIKLADETRKEAKRNEQRNKKVNEVKEPQVLRRSLRLKKNT